DIVGQRGQRVLHDGDAVAAAAEYVVHAAPAGAVGEGAVHQHDVADGAVFTGGGGRGGLRVRGEGGGQRGSQQGGEDPVHGRVLGWVGRRRASGDDWPVEALCPRRRAMGRPGVREI